MLKLGVIGLGHMGAYHASVCSMLTNAQLVGVADLNEKHFEKIKKKDVQFFKDYHNLLPLIDAVIIALPTELHYKVAKESLEHGVHVLVEKPFTQTVAEAEHLFNLAAQKNLALHVGHVERFNGALQELKKILYNPHLIEMQRVGPFNPRVAHDSVILDLMIHDIDIILSLITSPLVSFNIIGKKIHSPTCDIAHVQLSFANGTLATLMSSRASQIKNRSMTVHQEKEFLHLNFTTQDLSIHRSATSSIQIGQDQLKYRQETLVEHLFVYKDNPLKLEIEHFISAARQGSKLNNAENDTAALKLTFALEEKLGIRWLASSQAAALSL